jgi:hypothetical protein
METSTRLDTSTEPNLKICANWLSMAITTISETRLSDTLPEI